MPSHVSTQYEAYRTEIQRLAQAMATARKSAVHNALAEGFSPFQIDMFVDGNLDKRYDKLERQLETVAGAFENFDELLIQYIRHAPLKAYDTGATDGERMLDWLEATQPLCAEQRDHIRCQRARHQVEAIAGRNRTGHIAFQDLRSLTPALLPELETNHNLRIYLNPIRAASRFETAALLEDDVPLPADVLFFAVEDYVSTAVLEGPASAQIEQLARLSPCTLTSLLALLCETGDREDLLRLIEDLASIGLVALG